jgi:GxxExxY protein
MSELIYKDESYAIIGACFNVYKTMGCGFLESVYQECLELEFEYQGIPFTSQKELMLTYRDKELKQKYRADFICFEKIIIELKATSKLIKEHESQIINYLHATKFKLGILVNFGHHPKLDYKRFAF